MASKRKHKCGGEIEKIWPISKDPTVVAADQREIIRWKRDCANIIIIITNTNAHFPYSPIIYISEKVFETRKFLSFVLLHEFTEFCDTFLSPMK